MIKIKSQCAFHQYDEEGRAITTWDDQKCSWIVNSEFENEKIDWYGEDNDFPAGETMAEFLKRNPNWDKIPDIVVTWEWDKQGYLQQFGELPQRMRPDMERIAHMISGSERRHLYEIDPNFKFPCKATRQWGYLEYTKEQAIQELGKYCGFNKFSKTEVFYNGERIFEGKLQ